MAFRRQVLWIGTLYYMEGLRVYILRECLGNAWNGEGALREVMWGWHCEERLVLGGSWLHWGRGLLAVYGTRD
jgi:hypothetical protein